MLDHSPIQVVAVERSGALSQTRHEDLLDVESGDADDTWYVADCRQVWFSRDAADFVPRDLR